MDPKSDAGAASAVVGDDALRELCFCDAVFRERYEGWKVLGRGPWATVVRTRSRDLGQDIAVKVFVNLDSELLERVDIPGGLRTRGARWQTAPTLLVAPYYGVDPDGTRGGWRPEFVQRIRRAEYPQYVWDALPIGGPKESVLRLDHAFPVARNPAAFRATEHRLSSDALGVLDEWLTWLVRGTLEANSLLAYIRTQLLAMP